MRKIVLFLGTLLAALWISSASFAENKPFITKWKGEAGKELKIPIVGTYKLVIKKASDNTVLKNEMVTVGSEQTPFKYTPTESGDLIVEAGPEGVKYIRMGEIYIMPKTGSTTALVELIQFGDVAWTTMDCAFSCCINLKAAATLDAPKLENVTSTAFMFDSCVSFTTDVSKWDMSHVKEMNAMFSDCRDFTSDLSKWDLDHEIDNMCSMLNGCIKFQSDLSGWKVGKVKHMSYLFNGCESFTSDLSKWDVSSALSMAGMFANCKSFTSDLSNWKVDKVQYMENMFWGCKEFTSDLKDWKVDNVRNMSAMFSRCSKFNSDLSRWNVSTVTKMENLFWGCKEFNSDLSNWDVSNVTTMRWMFSNCTAFDQNLGKWKLKKCAYLGLDYSGISMENYSKSLQGWAEQADICDGMELEAYKMKYKKGEATTARTKLIDTKHWKIREDLSEDEQSYQVWIAGNLVTSTNISTIHNVLTTANALKSGNVSVTIVEDKPVVKLENVQIESPSSYYGIGSDVPITVDLHGTNTIKTVVNTTRAIYIEGEISGSSTADKLILTGFDPVFYGTIRNCTLEVEKSYNGDGNDLVIKDAIVKAKTIENFKSITFEHCSILKPQGAYFDAAKMAVVDEHGAIAQNVEIGMIAVTGVTLTPEKKDLEVGATFQLIAEVQPSNATHKDLEWSSDKPDFADVDQNGLVTAKAEGTAIITVKTKDVNHTKTCEITVTKKVEIKFKDAVVSVEEGKQRVLELQKINLEASEKVTLTTSADGTVKIVDNDAVKVEGVAVGEATITATVAANAKHGELKATCKVKVTKKGTAVEDAVLASVVVAPNPFVNQLRITNGDLRGTYALLNAQGVVVRSGVLDDTETVITTTELASGLYLLHLSAESGATKTYRLVKER
ncbi:MAG: BspA family leucine-rich repeat surface protein [Bacteroides sp.]